MFAFLQCLLISLGLSRTLANRAANQTLAVLLILLAGIITPWMIGFAGFYDKWRWLTFVPVAITLGVAPLLWIYVHALVHGYRPMTSWRHLAPAIAQFTFLFSSFLLPLPIKNDWAEIASTPYDLMATGGTLIGLGGYGWASLRLLRQYRSALAGQRSDDHRFASAWLARLLGALLCLLPFWAIYAVWDAIAPLGYTGLMGLYIGIAVFALFLGIEGWRHADRPFPQLDQLLPIEQPMVSPRDWAALGQQWADAVRVQGWAGPMTQN